jgi:beta-lactamase class A
LFGIALAIAAAIASAQSMASAREAAVSYMIQPGDTLSAIASTTGVSLDRLVTLNAIRNPDFIVAGQALSLDGSAAPGAGSAGVAPASPAPASGQQYKVKQGDTLWDIAQANGLTMDSLQVANNLSNADQLTIGQVLQLPATAAQRSAASTAAAKPTPTAPPKPVGSTAAASAGSGSSSAPGVAARASTGAAAAPTAPAKTSALQQKIASEALRLGGPNVHVGAAATNLVTGDKVSLHADDTFPSASVMKLPILVELERQIAAGTLSWTESLHAEASAMIAVSDNTAANQIAEAIHPQSVNDTMARLNLNGTHFLNLFTDARGPTNPGQNQTSPADMARLLEFIATDQIVSSQVSADIRTLLMRNVDRSKLVRLLPPDARVAHKSGWYDGVANDVGLVTVDRVPTRWVIAVFTEKIPDAETGNQIVAAISKAVYDAWAP